MPRKAAPAKKRGAGSKASNEAKKKYNSRVYAKYSFLVPRGGGLDAYLREIQSQGRSMGESVRRALVEYIARQPRKKDGPEGTPGD